MGLVERYGTVGEIRLCWPCWEIWHSACWILCDVHGNCVLCRWVLMEQPWSRCSTVVFLTSASTSPANCRRYIVFKCANLCTCVLVSFMFSFCNLCSGVAQMQKLRSPMLGIQGYQSSLFSVWSRSECNFVCYNCCQLFFLLQCFIILCGKFEPTLPE